MSIESFFTKSVKTQRLTRKGGVGEDKDTEIWEDYLSEVKCHIQTWAEGTVGYEGARSPTHQMWCAVGVDVEKGDRIIDGTITYEILGKEKLDFSGNPHLQIVLSLIE